MIYKMCSDSGGGKPWRCVSLDSRHKLALRGEEVRNLILGSLPLGSLFYFIPFVYFFLFIVLCVFLYFIITAALCVLINGMEWNSLTTEVRTSYRQVVPSERDILSVG